MGDATWNSIIIKQSLKLKMLNQSVIKHHGSAQCSLPLWWFDKLIYHILSHKLWFP